MSMSRARSCEASTLSRATIHPCGASSTLPPRWRAVWHATGDACSFQQYQEGDRAMETGAILGNSHDRNARCHLRTGDPLSTPHMSHRQFLDAERLFVGGPREGKNLLVGGGKRL